jgi:outer membrane protein assembly factor BamB
MARWRRQGRAMVWVLVALLAVFLGLLAYQRFVNRGHVNPDPDLLEELQTATLLEDEEPPPLPGPWPQWRGPRRDGVALDQDVLTAWPSGGPTRLWQAEGGKGYSSFAVGNGRAYTLIGQNDQDEIVLCWDAATGKELWRFTYSAPYQDDQGAGPRSTPTLDGDRLYTVGATGMFHCLDAATGKKLWGHNLLDEFGAHNLKWGTAFSPLVDGDLVFTNPGGPNGNSIAAFDKKTGELKWKALNDPAGYSSPVALTAGGVRQVVFFTGTRLVGLAAADGRQLWDFPWETQFQVNAATPLPFKARKGEQTLDYLFISSGYGKGSALVKIIPDGGGFRARAVYESTFLRSHFSSPVRHGDFLYGIDEKTTMLTCLDLRTGQVKWEERGFHRGSLMRVGQYLIVLGERGNLALADANPEKYHKVASARPLSGKCWTMPVLADGRLYLRNEQEVLCLDLGKKQ